jgi:hypothetical protein
MELDSIVRRWELEQLFTDYVHCLDADELEERCTELSCAVPADNEHVVGLSIVRRVMVRL